MDLSARLTLNPLLQNSQLNLIDSKCWNKSSPIWFTHHNLGKKHTVSQQAAEDERMLVSESYYCSQYIRKVAQRLTSEHRNRPPLSRMYVCNHIGMSVYAHTNQLYMISPPLHFIYCLQKLLSDIVIRKETDKNSTKCKFINRGNQALDVLNQFLSHRNFSDVFSKIVMFCLSLFIFYRLKGLYERSRSGRYYSTISSRLNSTGW